MESHWNIPDATYVFDFFFIRAKKDDFLTFSVVSPVFKRNRNENHSYDALREIGRQIDRQTDRPIDR